MMARSSPTPQLASIVAALLLGVWLVALFGTAWSGQALWFQAFVALWFAYNFFSWYVSSWRLAILSRRGSVLAAGFVIAGAALSGLSATGPGGLLGTAGMIALHAAILGAPFALNRLLRVPACRPHWSDLVVAAYLTALLAWWPTNGFHRLDGALHLGPFAAAALGATYFLGVRFWNRIKLELSLPGAGWGPTAGAAALVAIATWLDPTLGKPDAEPTLASILYGATLVAPLVATLVGGVALPTLSELGRTMPAHLRTLATIVPSALVFTAMLGWLTAPSFAAVVAAVVATWLTQRSRHILPAIIVTAVYMTLFMARGF